MENVIIIGGGMAGLSAGIYLARAGLKPLIYAGSPPGGQLTLTSDVENYPGVKSILGAELIETMRAQVVAFGGKIVDENVQTVKLVESVKSVESVKTKSVLIATGAKALWLNLPSEQRLRGHGVSACATCDGFFFKNKVVVVVGGGDSALEEALTLTKFAKHVIIIHRKGEFRASKIMQERVLSHPHIHELFNAQVIEVGGEQKVTSVTVKITPSNKELLNKSIAEIEAITPSLLQMKIIKKEGDSVIGTFPLDGIFVAIGHKPDTDLFKDKIELDRKGYILTFNRLAEEILRGNIELSQEKKEKITKNAQSLYSTHTSVRGVFAAGDCVDSVYRQASTAAGMGVGAALDVERWLESTK